MTPQTGTRAASATASRQVEVMVPQATSRAFTPHAARRAAFSREKAVISSALRPP